MSQAEIERLRAMVDTLTEENRQLRAMAFGDCVTGLMALFGLTKFQARILSCIIANEVASFTAIEAALWWDHDAPPDGADNSIKVLMVRVRKQVPEWARPISVWGIGFRLLPAARQRLKAMLAEQREAAAICADEQAGA